MKDDSIIDELNQLHERLFGARREPLALQGGPPFDIARPNIHDSKKEFLRELTAVQAVVENTEKIVNQLFGPEHKGDTEHQAMVLRLGVAIDRSARQNLHRTIPESASDLSLKNLVDTGFFHNSFFVLLDVLGVYQDRLKELKDQEVQYWSVPHRAPNYYARTIALRFARVYARERLVKPTFGTSREGPHPSTEFGRALEEVFHILGIKAHLRNAAEWAIGQLTEEDWSPQKNALGWVLMGDKPVGKPKEKTATEKIVDALMKGR